jgi:hypothetical protein
VIVGQPGTCVITSLVGLKSAIATLYSACLPPAVTITSLAAYRVPYSVS